MIKKYGSFFRKLVPAAILCAFLKPDATHAAPPNQALLADSVPVNGDANLSDIFLTDDVAPTVTFSAEALRVQIPNASAEVGAFPNLSLYLEIASGKYSRTEDFTGSRWAVAGIGAAKFADFGLLAGTTAALTETNLPSNRAATQQAGETHVMTVPEPSGKGLLALGALTVSVIIYRRRSKLL